MFEAALGVPPRIGRWYNAEDWLCWVVARSNSSFVDASLSVSLTLSYLVCSFFPVISRLHKCVSSVADTGFAPHVSQLNRKSCKTVVV